MSLWKNSVQVITFFSYIYWKNIHLMIISTEPATSQLFSVFTAVFLHKRDSSHFASFYIDLHYEAVCQQQHSMQTSSALLYSLSPQPGTILDSSSHLSQLLKALQLSLLPHIICLLGSSIGSRKPMTSCFGLDLLSGHL